MADEIITEHVQTGNTVKVKCLENNQEYTFSIVSTNEVNIFSGKISADSPIGRALIGHAKGDVVSLEAPTGIFNYEILEISKLS